MKVYVGVPAGLSRAMTRVADALAASAPPGVTITTDKNAADLVVLHVIGYSETVRAVEELQARSQKFAIIQYCMRYTQQSSTLPWAALWSEAEVVWSYYDLPQYAREDGLLAEDVNFYVAPLGCNKSVFHTLGASDRPYNILTSGYIPEAEGVLEAHAAVVAVQGHMVHLGPGDVRFDTNRVHQVLGISDQTLAGLYRRCQFVAGLRRGEGFELPAVEGLFCGARPIMFDRPHYRKWFDGYADFIEEGDAAQVTEALISLFNAGPQRVTELDLKSAHYDFSWDRVCAGFWQAIAPSTISVQPTRQRLLWVGDAAVSSGFARCTHHILDTLQLKYDVSVLGINYCGDPHPYPYPIYPTYALGERGDPLGARRLPSLVKSLKPDVVFLQNDVWNIPAYTNELKRHELKVPLLAGALAIDGLNCRGHWLNDLDLAVFWTEFGLHEAIRGGFTQRNNAVIPLGVDLDIYKPMDRKAARERIGLPADLSDAFIIGNVNRNQPRKRLDLTILSFVQWVKVHDIQDAYLFLHIAPTGDPGWDVEQLMNHFGFKDDRTRLIISDPPVGPGVTESALAAAYSAFDCMLTTTQGEGWGLTTMEGMACGIPQIVPKWAALGEWCTAALQLPCAHNIVTPGGVNAIGSVPDAASIVKALDFVYCDRAARRKLSKDGLALVNEQRFRWADIGAQYIVALERSAATVAA